MTRALSIRYYADALGSGRAQLMVDVTVDGRLLSELSGKVGSPAPEDAVRRYALANGLDLDVEPFEGRS